MAIGDFDWSLRGVRVKETGAFIPFSLGLAWDVCRGGIYIVAETLRPRLRPHLTMTFHPRPPRPWYLLWGALRQAGVRVSQSSTADFQAYFQDETYTDTAEPRPLGLNSACRDISKSHVAAVFEDVFGYGLSIDPRNAKTAYVAKSEINGRHDGEIRQGPSEPEDGWVYQRLIDNRSENGHVADIRCPTVFGDISLIYIKERPENQRFDNLNTKCRLSEPEDHLSTEERALVSRFCQKMGLDWGGLDILRDKADGRIYIVDVNKTDMGPPLALPLRHKLRSTRILGKALREALEARQS